MKKETKILLTKKINSIIEEVKSKYLKINEAINQAQEKLAQQAKNNNNYFENNISKVDKPSDEAIKEYSNMEYQRINLTFLSKYYKDKIESIYTFIVFSINLLSNDFINNVRDLTEFTKICQDLLKDIGKFYFRETSNSFVIFSLNYPENDYIGTSAYIAYVNFNYKTGKVEIEKNYNDQYLLNLKNNIEKSKSDFQNIEFNQDIVLNEIQKLRKLKVSQRKELESLQAKQHEEYLKANVLNIYVDADLR